MRRRPDASANHRFCEVCVKLLADACHRTFDAPDQVAASKRGLHLRDDVVPKFRIDAFVERGIPEHCELPSVRRDQDHRSVAIGSTVHAGTFELALSAFERIDLGVGDDLRAANGPTDPVSLRE